MSQERKYVVNIENFKKPPKISTLFYFIFLSAVAETHVNVKHKCEQRMSMEIKKNRIGTIFFASICHNKHKTDKFPTPNYTKKNNCAKTIDYLYLKF